MSSIQSLLFEERKGKKSCREKPGFLSIHLVNRMSFNNIKTVKKKGKAFYV